MTDKYANSLKEYKDIEFDEKKVKKSRKTAKEVTAYQIKIQLNQTTPQIWRRIEVLSNMSLNTLAYALILAMGWDYSHLYLYKIQGDEYGLTDEDDQFCNEWQNDRYIQLRDIIERGVESFTFLYDLGDGWNHTVFIEKEVQAKRSTSYPVCIDGEYNCPPEDCGGPHGFESYKKIISSPSSEQYQEMIDWRGDYDFQNFDLWLINMRLLKRKIPKNIKVKKLITG